MENLAEGSAVYCLIIEDERVSVRECTFAESEPTKDSDQEDRCIGAFGI